MLNKTFSSKMKELRESTGLNRKEFCKKFDIPYRTMTEWELGHRNAPPYVLRLLTYYIQMQKQLAENGLDEKDLGGE
ncbi:MAG: helix-turn-helix domain-containing protein [Lachnospiraceae bacterium]|nr:helix-turn-helix domain-containing protein [Lachnospiraceae bacterium]